MKKWLCILSLACMSPASALADQLLSKLSVEQLQAASMPEGVQFEISNVDGQSTAMITNTRQEGVSVQLSEVPLGSLEATRLSYEAILGSQEATQPAYLELWVIVKGEAYFSRALNQALTGTQPMRGTSTPFFLKAGEVADSARLGLRFEGPGTLAIRGIELWKRDSGNFGGARIGTLSGILGSIVGVSAGIWGALGSYYVSRGRGRRVILGTTAALATTGFTVFLYGAVAWMKGAEWDFWFTCVLLGGIVGLVEINTYVAWRTRYRQSEERRMLAMDMK